MTAMYFILQGKLLWKLIMFCCSTLKYAYARHRLRFTQPNSASMFSLRVKSSSTIVDAHDYHAVAIIVFVGNTGRCICVNCDFTSYL